MPTSSAASRRRCFCGSAVSSWCCRRTLPPSQAAFVFAGGAVGVLLATARDRRAEGRVQAALALAGAALVALGFYTAGRPSIYRVSSFWTSSPTWFAIRLGILTVSLSVIYVVAA